MAMAKFMILGFALLALVGCATAESVQRQAIANCQAVGISESDPQFATCTYAYARTHLERGLENAYRDALDAAPRTANATMLGFSRTGSPFRPEKTATSAKNPVTSR
jgi:uncharacterized lipoprotein NlpE involved in copper resistance